MDGEDVIQWLSRLFRDGDIGVSPSNRGENKRSFVFGRIHTVGQEAHGAGGMGERGEYSLLGGFDGILGSKNLVRTLRVHQKNLTLRTSWTLVESICAFRWLRSPSSRQENVVPRPPSLCRRLENGGGGSLTV